LIEESKSADPMTIAFAEARSAELRGEAPIGAAEMLRTFFAARR
jgi:hypothetical protein